jgi:hypothetical protein
MNVSYTSESHSHPPAINNTFYRSCFTLLRKEVSSGRNALLTKLYIEFTDF